MPPLLCPPPTIIDQSFPRDESELRDASIALGELAYLLENGVISIALTQILQDFVTEIDWERPPGVQGLLREIYTLLNQWFLQPHRDLIIINVDSIGEYQPHPVPVGCHSKGLVELWSDELGRILVLHDIGSSGKSFFMGVVCSSAFSGGRIGSYDNPQKLRVFPLIGPETINELEDAFEWEIPLDIHKRSVTFQLAKKNCHVLGGHCEPPSSGGSHYKVRFPNGARPWVLDPNVNPIPDEFLRELVEIIGKPLKYIKVALINGTPPAKRFRLSHVAQKQ